MLLYHRTYNADAILAEGFKNGTGYYLTDRLLSGVWRADRRLDVNEGVKGDVLLAAEMSEHHAMYLERRGPTIK